MTSETPIVQFIDVCKSFDGNLILENLNLSINKGDLIAIIGPSGCGKSTLLRLMLGLFKPDSGHVFIEGEDITTMGQEKILKVRQKIGMLFQSAALFDSLSVGENVAFTLRENRDYSESLIQERVQEKLALVEMSGREDDSPSELSGGQKKRIGLARAIACDPSIVLYDEPTTGLDPILSTNIENLIVKLNKNYGMTSIVVTHQISTILRASEKIYLLSEHKLLEPETAETIETSKSRAYRRFISGGL